MVLHKIHSWYTKFERPIGIVSLVGGFIFNALTLKRVDLFVENFWVIAHLLIVAICIIILNTRKTTSEGSEANPSPLHFWTTTVLQFFYGGLLSTFIVFYFRSAVLAVAWPFFAILAVAFIANEKFKAKYTALSFQIAYFYLCTYLFFIFFIPVLVHQTGQWIFLLSGACTLVVLVLFLWLLRTFAHKHFTESKKSLLAGIIGIFCVMNALYFLDIIPPLPLSLQDAGIFHSISRTNDGNYQIVKETETSWDTFLSYLNLYPTYHTSVDAPVYAYSAIFSPTAFNTKIIHEWQKYEPASGSWVTKETIALSVLGGRENGYRTYSLNNGLTEGKWRVNVKTNTGQTIGRMNFTVSNSAAIVPFVVDTK